MQLGVIEVLELDVFLLYLVLVLLRFVAGEGVVVLFGNFRICFFFKNFLFALDGVLELIMVEDTFQRWFCIH